MIATAQKLAPVEAWVTDFLPTELEKRLQKIRPVVKLGDILYFIKPVDPVNASFIWNPVVTNIALMLVKVEDITTFHRRGPHLKFQPTIAEVLEVIPDHLVDTVVAFEIIKRPETNAETQQALDDGHFTATTRLYRDA